MENEKYYKLDGYCVYVTIADSWRYIVNVSEIEFKHVIEEAEACSCNRGKELIIETEKDEIFLNKNYIFDGRIFAYIRYIEIGNFQ